MPNTILMTKRKKVKIRNLFNHKKCQCQKPKDAIMAYEEDRVVIFLSSSLSHMRISLFLLKAKIKLQLCNKLLSPFTCQTQIPLVKAEKWLSPCVIGGLYLHIVSRFGICCLNLYLNFYV